MKLFFFYHFCNYLFFLVGKIHCELLNGRIQLTHCFQVFILFRFKFFLKRIWKNIKVSYIHKSIKLFTSLHRQLAICFLPIHCCLLIVSPAEYVHNFVHCLHHMCCYHYSSNNVNQINVIWLVGWFIVFNVTFNNISVILWQSILLEEETGENHWPVAIHWQILSHYVVSSTPPHEQGSKSNYHTITTMTAPKCHLTCWIVITCLFMNKFNMNIFLFYFKFYLT
jgi:hypothetical protein